MTKKLHSLSSVFILTRSLHVGGAETQICALAEALHQKGYKVTVGLFYAGGLLEKKLSQAGVSIYPLEKKGRWNLIGWFRRYLCALRQTNPDVIYSFLTTSNIVATLGNFFVRIPIVWGIRASNMKLNHYDGLARFIAWIEKKLSPYAQTIIFNAKISYDHHQSLGYHFNKATVIPNGIDTDKFKSLSKSEKSLRRHQLNIPQDAMVVGMFARVDPMKDYETFLSAARTLSSRHPHLYFVIAGKGTDTLSCGNLPSNFLRLGVREDVCEVMNTLDMFVLCSAFGEGFPNVVGEAMACGVPAIVTDVGDSAFIVGDQGMVIPPQNPETLIQAIESFMRQKPSSQDVRHRIVSNFSIPQMVDKTLETLSQACQSS